MLKQSWLKGRTFAILASVLTLFLSVSSCVSADVKGTIHPAVLSWLDDAGAPIQAHGAGLIQVGDTYYWIGENKAGLTSDELYQGISCYSSKDLQNWHLEGTALGVQGSGDLSRNRVVERPKVIYNSSTGKYVMYMHTTDSNYSLTDVGVATSSAVCGPYQYQGSYQPLGNASYDMTLFKDGTTGYLIGEQRKGSGIAGGIKIYKLSSDYLSVTSLVATVDAGESHSPEAPAVFKANGKYFMLLSHQSGWGLNDNYYETADSMAGPWTYAGNFAPTGTDTFSSQTAYVLPVTGNSGTTYMYMGDRWIGSYLQDSSYVWLPLTVSGSTVKLSKWSDGYTLDLTTGILSSAIPVAQYGQPTSGTVLSGGATVNSNCTLCFAMETSIGNLGGPSNGTVTFNNVVAAHAGKRSLYIRYFNNDGASRYATVKINGASTVVTFKPTGVYGVAVTVPFNALAGGNTVSIFTATVANQSTSYGPDIEEIYFDNN